LFQQTLKIAVGRDQDEIVRCGVFQNLPIANTGLAYFEARFRIQGTFA
jgi:hypothetical protein